jgi:hypothetical protein
VELTDLRALLALLRDFNVLEYSADGVSLRLGAARPDQQPAVDTAAPQPAMTLRAAAATVSPALVDAVDRLPAGYGAYFTGAASKVGD